MQERQRELRDYMAAIDASEKPAPPSGLDSARPGALQLLVKARAIMRREIRSRTRSFPGLGCFDFFHQSSLQGTERQQHSQWLCLSNDIIMVSTTAAPWAPTRQEADRASDGHCTKAKSLSRLPEFFASQAGVRAVTFCLVWPFLPSFFFLALLCAPLCF